MAHPETVCIHTIISKGEADYPKCYTGSPRQCKQFINWMGGCKTKNIIYIKVIYYIYIYIYVLFKHLGENCKNRKTITRMSQCTQHINYFLEDSDFSAFLFLPVMGSIFRSISAMPSFAFWRRIFSFESWRWKINDVCTTRQFFDLTKSLTLWSWILMFDDLFVNQTPKTDPWVTRKMLSCNPLSKDSCSWVRWPTRPAVREATSFSMASRTFGDLKTTWATNGKKK